MALLKMSADIRYTEDRNGAVQLKSHLPTAPSGYRLWTREEKDNVW